MKKLLAIVLVLAIAAGVVGYWRGWFSVTRDGNLAVQFDSGKFQQDKDEFGQKVGEKARAVKDDIARLWSKSETLSGDEKDRVQKELAELRQRQERLEAQIQELKGAGEGRFESLKQDLASSLDDVQRRIAELSKKLDAAPKK
jgi:TolA-binding protein